MAGVLEILDATWLAPLGGQGPGLRQLALCQVGSSQDPPSRGCPDPWAWSTAGLCTCLLCKSEELCSSPQDPGAPVLGGLCSQAQVVFQGLLMEF